MKQLKSICLVTHNVPRLRTFYEAVLQREGEGDDVFVAFVPAGIGLCLYAAQGMETLAPGSMVGAGAGSAVIEFQVEDVDGEYARLMGLGVPIVKPPTTQPWGLRSVWFRDPDGNIVNYYAPVGEAVGA
jgi:catechol 2,3-dioxygenase-like lactoylglutathione lyase family enzyme